MFALIFILGSILLGIGVTRSFFPFSSKAEQFFWGPVIGSMVTVWAAYLVSRVLQKLHFSVLAVIIILSWGIAIYLLRHDWKKLRNFSFKNAFKNSFLLLLLLLILMPVFTYFFYMGMFHPQENGWNLTATSWYDMALHLAIASSFNYGDNFPPMYQVMPSEPLNYPFLPDFHVSILLKLGMNIWPAFYLTAIIMAFCLTGIFYLFVKRLVDSRGASFIASLLFFFNGGLGFIIFIQDWSESKKNFYEYFPVMKENYTDIWGKGIKFANLIASGLVPQRAMLYGMPAAFIILALFAVQWRKWANSETEKRWDGLKILLPAGIITGMLPMFHAHSWMAAGFVSIFLFLVKPRYVWLAYWLPAVILAVPQLFTVSNTLAAGTFMRFMPGWLSGLEVDFLLFLFKNFGLPILLVFPAFYSAPRYLKTFYIPFAAIFAFCFLIIISPNEFDNLKLIYYWHALTAVVVGYWLYRLIKVHRQVFLAVLIIIGSTISGILTIPREAKLIYRIFSNQEIEAGIFARDSMPAKSVILTAQYHNQPALCIGGKYLILGYDFWIRSHGYPEAYLNAVQEDVKKMFANPYESLALFEKYGVDYIYIGPQEREKLTIAADFFKSHYKEVFRNEDIVIYDYHQVINGYSN